MKTLRHLTLTLAACLLAAVPLHAAVVTATFTRATDVPLTVAIYTATGNSVDFTLSYAPVTGTTLIVVQNTGLGFISGTLSNLAQGQAVPLSFGGVTYNFVANYFGGTGNDLVLHWAGSRPYGWGLNNDRQLGNGSTTNSSLPVAVNTSGVLAGKTVIAVAAGGSHTLALCSDGTLAAWGANNLGQLGNNNLGTDSGVPVAVDTTGVLAGKTVVAISTGYIHSLVLCSDGTVAAWGYNADGELGNNSTTNSSLPVAVDASGVLNGKTVVAIAAGELHSLALCSDGTVAAWGANADGQLGNNSFVDSSVPVTVSATGGLLGKTVIAIAASAHSLAVCSDGSVAAWGNNGTGQLGNSSFVDSSVPVSVDTSGVLAGKTVIAVAAGYSHSLALCSDGSLAAWGYNDGRLGDGTFNGSSVPVAVRMEGVLAGRAVIAIGAGQQHSLALCSDGRMATWGEGSFGQLGVGNTGNSFLPLLVSTAPLAAGDHFAGLDSGARALHTVALVAPAPVLPTAITATFTSATDVPLTVAEFTATGRTVNLSLTSAIPTGSTLTVVKNTGNAPISGTFSNLAQGQAVTLNVNGVDYPFVANYFGGSGNDLVLHWAGTRVFDWGYNDNGQLGNNSTGISSLPVEVSASGVLAGKTVIAVAAGAVHTLALCSDGTVAAWGDNDNGQLGNNSTTDSHVPVAVTTSGVLSGKTVIAIAAGGYHSLALCSDGSVAAWGYNGQGQLGDNSTTDSHVPVLVDTTGVLSGKTVIAVAAGHYHSLALCSDGSVVAWGHNVYGQLGNSSTTNSSVPVAVTMTGVLLSKSVIAVSGGLGHSLALCSDGSVAAWGYNANGQLGNASTTNSSEPVAVSTGGVLSGKTVITLAAGNAHSLTLCSDGTVAAWGYNGNGQLGNNTTTDSSVPVAVNATGVLAGKTVIAVAAGQYHSLALCSDGSVATWGLNTNGQLGNASTTDSSVPVLVSTTPLPVGARFAAIGNGPVANHSAALMAEAIVFPEMRVIGNSLAIANADSTPTLADGTDFGSVALLNTVVLRSFTISNIGSAPLILSGTPRVLINGPGAAEFTITAQPLSPVAEAGSSRFEIAFDPRSPGLRTATVSIANDDGSTNPYTFAISGVGALAVKKAQTIAFSPPATVYVAQSPLALSAIASSGLPVTLSVVSGPATLSGSTLTLTGGLGTVKVKAMQTGDTLYAAAPAVTKTITVKAAPSVLTLVDLLQVYDGSPKPISTLGGTSPVISYTIGGMMSSNAPTDAGSYPITVVDGVETKTAKLVIAKAVLDVTPDDKRKFAGRANPALTAVITGYQGSDTPAVVTTAPVLSTTATLTSARGLYPITAKSGAALNYTFNYRQGTLIVESFVGGYEALLVDGGDLAVGKLNITVTGAASFTGKLYVSPEAAPLPLTGTLASNPSTGQASSTVLNIASDGTPYVTSFTMPLSDAEPMTASVVRDNTAFGTAADGRKLGTAAVPYAGAHTAVLEPATPPGVGVPLGAGWATANISATGVLTLTGKLGDSIAFTTALSADTASSPGYRLFAQPYLAARKGSYLGGKFNLAAHPSLTNRRYLEAAALTWSKLGLPTDATYRAGFGPVSTVLMIDPWLAPKTTAPTISLAQRLGLPGTAFDVTHSATGSASNGNLPTQLNLSATNVVSVLLPLANLTKWKTLTFVPTTGTFTGSFELTDAIKRTVTFSGVLRQPATTTDTLIGDGHYLLPPPTGTEKTTGDVMFTRP